LELLAEPDTSGGGGGGGEYLSVATGAADLPRITLVSGVAIVVVEAGAK